VLDAKWSGTPHKYVDVSARRTICRIPDSKNLHATFYDEGRLPQISTHIYQRIKWSWHLRAAADMCNFAKAVYWTLSIVYISIKLHRFGSWIFFRLQVKKGRTETPAVGLPGGASLRPGHTQLYCTPSQPWRPVATLCSLMNVRYISAQGLETFTSGLNKIHISLKQ
jgi:hypothetical protein